MDEDLLTCLRCRAATPERRAGLPLEVEAAGRTFALEVPGAVCPGCGEKSFGLGAMLVAERRIALALLDSGEVSPENLRFLRRSILGVQARDLARQIFTTPETLSRWENGHIPIPPLAFLAVAQMVRDFIGAPRSAEQCLALLAEPKPLPKKVSL